MIQYLYYLYLAASISLRRLPYRRYQLEQSDGRNME
jgi:hypothetical protein